MHDHRTPRRPRTSEPRSVVLAREAEARRTATLAARAATASAAALLRGADVTDLLGTPAAPRIPAPRR